AGLCCGTEAWAGSIVGWGSQKISPDISNSVLIGAGIGYNVIGLGSLPDGSGGVAKAINNHGLIGGSGWPASGSYAAILFDSTGAGNNVDLNPGGGWSTVRSISDSGQIVGFDVDAGALLFDNSGSGNNINLGGGKRAYSINNNNQIVGGSGNGVSTSAWLWDLTDGINIILLGQGEATSISDTGMIVGSSNPVSGDGRHATLFDPTGNGNNIDLGKLFAGDDRSFARSINDSGQIVGYSGGPGAGYTATLYDLSGNGNNIALGAIGNSKAYCINNIGQIAGSENGFATLFDITGTGDNINLNDLIDPTLGWTLTSASCINDNGWIIGSGYNPAGNIHAYLLIPLPMVVEAEVEISPNTLNLRSKGKWITCHIRLPEEYDVADVNPYSVFLEDEIEAEWIWFDEDQQVVMAKFSRRAVKEELGELETTGEVELVVSGELSDGLVVSGELSDGTIFEGTDTIRVIDKGKRRNNLPGRAGRRIILKRK
ncbi:MAG: hypothetical protein ACYTE5_04395, partial [Planctomycetota bacterium]